MSHSASDEIFCKRCQHKNEPGALTCVWCGADLTSDTTTVRVPDQMIGQALKQAASLSHDAICEGLVLYIAGAINPVEIGSRPKVILGRDTQHEHQAVVDLTPYNAGALGVSRQHALLELNEQGYTVRDLGSTNGTWLNEKQIPAHLSFLIQNGDQLRLGQLILFAYFSSQQNKQIITLRDSVFEQGEKVVGAAQFLTAHAGPYLDALVGIQQLVNEWLHRDGTVVEVGSINVDGENGTVVVSLKGATETVKLIAHTIQPWKQQRMPLLARLNAAEKESRASSNAEYVRIYNEFLHVEEALAEAIVEMVMPELNGYHPNNYAQRLMPLLSTLITSSLCLE